ncbi:hypothetical protein [Oleidesulfovibrio sp.]|uniref:hypothetical protein n=1 Tax=Oleidesulfovibrio sp. TaxID=2909707 RepID=UPI003A881E3C
MSNPKTMNKLVRELEELRADHAALLNLYEIQKQRHEWLTDFVDKLEERVASLEAPFERATVQASEVPDVAQ